MSREYAEINNFFIKNLVLSYFTTVILKLQNNPDSITPVINFICLESVSSKSVFSNFTLIIELLLSVNPL